MDINILDAIKAPLKGNILIEASAGTGKTFTITTLVLRLLLGLNDNTESLKLESILIVTFTNAATAELKERIFKRIIEFKEALITNESDDLVLISLMDLVLNEEFEITRKDAIAKLIMAEREIDQAAIFTIHGFCQRVISQYAFSANLSFNMELNRDLSELLEQAANDFWRRECYLFSTDLTNLANRYYQSPSEIVKQVYPYIRNPQLLHQESHIIVDRVDLEHYFQDFFNQILTVKKAWLESNDEILGLIESSGINKRRYSSRHLPNWLQQITDWASNNEKDSIAENLYRFAQNELTDNTKEGSIPAQHPLFEQIEALINQAQQLESERVLNLFAVSHILSLFDDLKAERNEMGFDDILIQLSNVLQKPNAYALINSIRHNYHAIMIDEFQDTDGYQYSIFERLFVKSDHPFIMIGDPKQSIYKFRGADIFVYLEAKRGADKVYTLDTNYRSSDVVIQGVNRLFSFNQNPFFEEAIPFYAVSSADNADKKWLIENGEKKAGIHFLTAILSDNPDSPSANRALYLDLMAEAFANRTVELLNNGMIEEEKESRVVVPADITFLVRSGSEAAIIKTALIERGLNAVYLSERSNVFESVMAQEILVLLRSLLSPRDSILIKRLLSSLLLGLSLDQYHAITENEMLFEAHLLERQDLKKIWDRYGVLALIRAIIMRDDRLSHLQALGDGERLVTDLFHLAEILQEQNFPTQIMLVEWLEERLEAQEGDEEFHLRLESDFEAIKIMTLHKSKGLEFPIVMMPFVLSYLNYRGPSTFYDRQREQLRYAFTPDKTIQDQIVAEEYAEAVRLLYVGITRAKYHCQIGYSPDVTHGRGRRLIVPDSALGYLLNLTEANSVDECEIPHLLLDPNDLNESESKIISASRFDSNQISRENYYANGVEEESLQSATLKRMIENRWRFTSFSHLSYNAQSTYFQQENYLDEIDLMADNSDNSDDVSDREENREKKDEGNAQTVEEGSNFDLFAEMVETEKESDIPQFPKGVNTGNFIHDLLESSTPHQLMDREHLAHALEQSILYSELESSFDEWVDQLHAWFTDILNTTLSCGISLGEILSSDTHINELEFLFPVKGLLTPKSVEIIINQHRQGEMPSQFNFERLTGMLKGFIDLTFVHNGKYYICDYKSNYLGDYRSDYGDDQLKSAIYRANYDWQYLLYTLALVKFLRLNNPNFDYERDFGGIYYLFVRGMKVGKTSGIYYRKPDAQLIDSMEQLFMGETDE